MSTQPEDQTFVDELRSQELVVIVAPPGTVACLRVPENLDVRLGTCCRYEKLR